MSSLPSIFYVFTQDYSQYESLADTYDSCLASSGYRRLLSSEESCRSTYLTALKEIRGTKVRSLQLLQSIAMVGNGRQQSEERSLSMENVAANWVKLQ